MTAKYNAPDHGFPFGEDAKIKVGLVNNKLIIIHMFLNIGYPQ